MKKLLILTGFIFICSLQPLLATNVSGVISSNATWNLAGSPYIVTSYVTVNNGVTLTVDSGVTVKFNDGQYMLVYGVMNATDATFTSNNASPVPGIWSYIQTGGSNTTDVGSVNMSGCQISYASTFYVYRGKATLTNTDLLNFNTDGVNVMANGRFKMTGGSINTNSATAAASYSGILGNTSSIDTLAGVTIQHFQYGINLQQGSAFDLTSAIITACNWPIYFAGAASLNLHGINSFTGNTNSMVNFSFNSVTGAMTLPAINIPYYFSTQITIQHGASMTIQPGNIIKMAPGQWLGVYGQLNATSAIFTSGNASPAPGDWGYIQVGSFTLADSGRVTLTSCQIQYASMFYVYNGKASLINTDLLNFNSQGAQIMGNGNLFMTGGSITTSSPNAAAAGCNIFAGANARAAISGVNMQNMQYGIYLNADAKINIAGITISNCKWPVFYAASADLTTTGTNTMNGNVNKAAYMGFYNFSDTLALPKLPVPYYFPNTMTINAGARMVIASTSILKFQDYTALDVNGTLVAEANPGENIFFTSYKDDNWGGDTNNDGTNTTPASGNWYGVRFNDASNDATCLMRRCKLRYAGYGNIGGVSMYNASPTIDQCDLSINYYGAFMQYVSNPVFSNNTVGSSLMTPIALSYEANPVLSNNTLSFSDNAYDAIGLLGGTMTANAVLPVRNFTAIPNITYLMLDNITVPQGKTLTINKGVVIKAYYANYGYDYRKIIVEGKLIAVGTPDSMIVLTSARDDNFGNPFDTNKDGSQTSPAIGDWGGFLFKGTSDTTSMLNYCRIYYGDNNDHFIYYDQNQWPYNIYRGGQITLENASPAITNCVIKHNEFGVYCAGNGHPRIFNNSFDHSTVVAVAKSISANPYFAGNTMMNCGYTALGVIGEQLGSGGTLARQNFAGYTNITYLLLDELFINTGTNVTIDSGVVIKVNTTANRRRIEVNGGLKINGGSLPGNEVVFTSAKDDNAGNPGDSNNDGSQTSPAGGDWGRIQFNETSDDLFCKVKNTKVKYGGFTGYWSETKSGMLAFVSANTSVSNASLSGSSNYGFWVDGSSVPVINGAIIQNCVSDPMAMSLTSDPQLNNISFVNNASNGLRIIEGTLSSNATLKKRNVAGYTNIAYIVQQLTISANAVLTIQPGVIIKFPFYEIYNYYSYKGCITVNGGLSAVGTASEPIVFTSNRDDSKGGDTNNDGNSTIPQKGDWRYIEFNSSGNSQPNKMENCLFSYGGAFSPYQDNPQYYFKRFGEICINSTSVIIDSCVFEHSGSSGIGIYGNSSPVISNTEFSNIASTPVTMSLFSNPVFGNNNIVSNVGLFGLGVAVENYSIDDTVIKRNFAGIPNITYIMFGTYDGNYYNSSINSGTTICVPEGIVFKYQGYYNNGSLGQPYFRCLDINGALKISGTQNEPVVFTDYRDDSYGNPMDSNGDGSLTAPAINQQYILKFNDISDDQNCIINHAIFKYQNDAIMIQQASPTIKNSRFEKDNRGINMAGNSQPVVDSCTFHNLTYTPLEFSLVSYPSSTAGNIISGTTYKALGVKAETMAQNITLPKRAFGGQVNIPYYFHDNFIIGTSSVMTVEPGVTLKFNEGKGLNIKKGLLAIGGATADSNIVFTEIRDDFYGGDSNSDSTATQPGGGEYNPAGYIRSPWTGLTFENESNDALCKLNHCIVRFAGYIKTIPLWGSIPDFPGITLNSASPTILNSAVNKNRIGLLANGASNPLVNNCDIYGNQLYGIQNVGLAFNINAGNCWWGSNTGPTHSGNPGGTGDAVTYMVDYTPWKANGAGAPLMGDVSLNGSVSAYDASLVLKYAVGLIPLTSVQQLVANTSGAAGITAYDASLILQYSVGLINFFPAELLKAANAALTDPQLMVGNATATSGEEVSIPVTVINNSGMVSGDICLKYDPAYLEVKNVANLIQGMNFSFSNDSINGLITIALAGTIPLNTDTTLAMVTFAVRCQPYQSVTTPITVNAFLANETDLTANAISGSVTIHGMLTGIPGGSDLTPAKMLPVFPNPATGDATLTWFLNVDNQYVTIQIFNMMGQKMATIADGPMSIGKHSVTLSATTLNLKPGTYLIRLSADGFVQTQILQLTR
ncbi:MAG: cohesin domain-containing protein [Bacteroidetes bacterium]|nr:cohesin domain-containing protein [Bacteroidota bacterium]